MPNNDMPLYYSLQDFLEKTSMGEINPAYPIQLRSIDGNKLHQISYLDHCNYLSKKHESNILKLLSVLHQKLNGDMIIRLNKSPCLGKKIQNLLNEWGHEELGPNDLFDCDNNLYDSNDLLKLIESINSYDKDFELLKDNSDFEESQVYDNICKLRDNYDMSLESLNDMISDIEENMNNNVNRLNHYPILSDLSTKHKSFYLDELLSDDNNVSRNMNIKVNKDIPDNINLIFLNIILIPTLISKEMELLKNRCFSLKSSNHKKIEELNELLDRFGNKDSDLSKDFLQMINNITSFFNEVNDDETTKTVEDKKVNNSDMNKVNELMNNIVKSKNSDKSQELTVRENNDNDNDDDESVSEYELSLKKDENPSTLFDDSADKYESDDDEK
jgi:hypothetical protein